MSRREKLGAPDLNIATFQLWVHGRENPGSNDYHDGNWVRTTAHCGAQGASVWVDGPLVSVVDIASFSDECGKMLANAADRASLKSLEPELKVSLERLTDEAPDFAVRVDLTPDNLNQYHRFAMTIDVSALPGIIEECAAVIRNFPVRGLPDAG